MDLFSFLAESFDLPILDWIAANLWCPFLDAVMPVITLLGDAGIFWIAIAVLFALFSVPFFPSVNGICVNGIFEMCCIMLIFPSLVWLGASGVTSDKASTGVCKFLGDISYPLYIVHYPVMYLFYAWLIKNQLYTLGETWQVVACVYATNVLLAFAALKLYDEPVRKWLTGKLKIGMKK